MRFVLASASERRQELLRRILPEYEITVSSFDESLVPYKGDESAYVIELSRSKSHSVRDLYMNSEDVLIIGSDTIVSLDGTIYGKPIDREAASLMIRSMSGKWHSVYSGISVTSADGSTDSSFSVRTDVKFMKMTDAEMEEYLDTLDWVGKAGGYGIQGESSKYIEEIRGDYYNVMGLPLNALYKNLKELDILG
ncbi:Maf family protein [Youngiibacter fragilis]|uniref:dTTP/UTP pyrophosphatase n=1 Tax=Youngiibacter fragilis 232.1 TaxID=994573 RepID=V7I7F8_9CLOT|nr:Maf family protein [Youngiibacter fragilis]ETA80962.1 septum formation protein Maf [Youngiibacter fragilis 232.1]